MNKITGGIPIDGALRPSLAWLRARAKEAAE